MEKGGAMAPQGLKDAAPALAGIKGMTVAVDFTVTQEIKLDAKVLCKNAEDAAKIKTGIEDTWGMFKGMMQLAAGFQMPGQPQLPATLMGDLNSVTFATKGDTVTGALKISSQTVQDLAKMGAGQMVMPGKGQAPPPINPKFPAKKGFPPQFDGGKQGFQPQFDGGMKDATPDDMKKMVGKLEPGKGASFTVNNVLQGQYQERRYAFLQGKRVTITMTSTVTDKFTDVDLYVYQGDAGQQFVAADVSVGPNGTVTFVVPATGTYRVRVVNLGPGTATSSVVTITEQ